MILSIGFPRQKLKGYPLELQMCVPQGATYREGAIMLHEPVDWPDGTHVIVTPVADRPSISGDTRGPVIIAGFGLAGRCVADLLDAANIPFTIVEKNRDTVSTQMVLGRNIIHGDIADEETLRQAQIVQASILALTIPEEDEVLRAVRLARQHQPALFIIARTQYSSTGLLARQLGADEVIKAEQAVALQFFDCVRRRIGASV